MNEYHGSSHIEITYDTEFAEYLDDINEKEVYIQIYNNWYKMKEVCFVDKSYYGNFVKNTISFTGIFKIKDIHIIRKLKIQTLKESLPV